ncbi:RIPOR family member 3 isoform X1 [Syngnathus scovelli]|uniref:RIPOR family member 3 isoform X1 n=1 Tax=Syngnathus scovelli TaxID=161590 RepID=UPI00210FA71E|nr:RIPOR family member 3 isoform X1 [Syngnathus scovelli]XP_049590203.1 RIPOR family member 3 isoform X1 [Syngnathus scovelli]XP_049590204.1 RIPOR family member 3 isoform X1 [Syngnathus scovelli]
MSVKLRFDSPSDGKPIRRSRSFTGFGSLTGRRRPSSTRNSLRLNSVSERKTPRAPLSPRRGFGAVWSMQPEDVDHVFQALHKGLREHVQRHQTEMDFLSSRLQETKRNSRLGFQYDLDKEIRVHERLIRKLEFQKSKVDELYENYCVQWRLCQGAVNMKRAFSLAPSTRESRESLLELGRSHRHSEQAMSAMEEELEVLLGELHVKMKGLIGFARLCPRDQYEVVLQLGCQRWRIRGRIQSDDVQSWDEEEMLFLPHIKHNFEIKVSEAKGLGWQLVGAVTCASAHFFAATPQLMLVDITQLGTIKLQLEVTWNPLDSGEKVGLMSSGRPSGRSRKTSVQSWTAPSTPSFSEKHFLSMVQELQEGGGGASVPLRMIKSGRDRGVSLMSYLSHSSITSSLSQAKTPPSSSSVAGSHTQLSLGEDREGRVTGERRGRKLGGKEEEEEDENGEPWGGTFASSSSLVDLPSFRSSTPDILKDNQDNPAGSCEEAKDRQPDGVSRECKGIGEFPASPVASAAAEPGGGEQRTQALQLGTLLGELERSLRPLRSCESQLRLLKQQIEHLNTILRNDLSLIRPSSWDDTLAMEEVLCSFDFLSHDDDSSCSGGMSCPRSPLPQNHRWGCEKEPPVVPLTCGHWGLDQVLETHLDTCCILLEMLQRINFSLTRVDLLEDVSQQVDVLNRIGCLLLEDKNGISTEDLLPEDQRSRDVLLLWAECVRDSDSSSPFCCHSDNFVNALRKQYSHKIKANAEAKQPGLSERVFRTLLQQVQAACRVALWPPQPPSAADRVSVFQLSIYLRRCGIATLGEHVAHLAKEEYFLSALKGPKRRGMLNRMTSRGVARLLPLGCTLQAIAALLTDADRKAGRAAASCLRRASVCATFRARALVYFTESLRSTDVVVQRNSCLALQCLAVSAQRPPIALAPTHSFVFVCVYLQATESVEHMVELRRCPNEDVQNAAKEAVLSFGKKGHAAFQKMEQLDLEMQEDFFQNLETEITFL